MTTIRKNKYHRKLQPLFLEARHNCHLLTIFCTASTCKPYDPCLSFQVRKRIFYPYLISSDYSDFFLSSLSSRTEHQWGKTRCNIRQSLIAWCPELLPPCLGYCKWKVGQTTQLQWILFILARLVSHSVSLHHWLIYKHDRLWGTDKCLIKIS